MRVFIWYLCFSAHRKCRVALLFCTCVYRLWQ